MQQKFYYYWVIGFIFMGITIQHTQAQSDYNFTQFQNTPFLTNPAMIPMHNDIQLLFNFRNQPNATGDNFVTGKITGLYPFLRKSNASRWGGIGLSFLHDRAGDFLRTNAGMISLALNQQLGKDKLGYHFLSLGVQGGFFQRSLNFDGLNTSSQYLDGRFRPDLVINEPVDMMNQTYPVISGGLMWYANDSLDRNNMFLGVSWMNANQPQTSFYDAIIDKLSHHFNITGGVRVLERERFSFTPNFRWVIRSGNNQVNAGSWFNFYLTPQEKQGFLRNGTASIGLWYNFNNAFVGALQLEQPRYFLTLSFDLPTANTSNIWQGSNAFELTLGIKFKRNIIRKPFYAIDTLTPQPIQIVANPPKPKQITLNPIPIIPKKKEIPRTKPGLEDGAFRFKFGSSELDEKSKILLDSVSQVLMEFPEVVIEVSGHTCDIGTDEANLALSIKRAEAMRKYLSEYDGIDPKRIRIAGFGESKPLVPNTNEDNRKINRRVAFKLRFPE